MFNKTEADLFEGGKLVTSWFGFAGATAILGGVVFASAMALGNVNDDRAANQTVLGELTVDSGAPNGDARHEANDLRTGPSDRRQDEQPLPMESVSPTWSTTAPVPTTPAPTTPAPTTPSTTTAPTTAPPTTTPTTTAPPTTAPPTTTPTTTTPPTTAAPTTTPAPSNDLAGFRQAVLVITNAERAKVGCAPLELHPVLNDVAQAHSEDMIARGYFDHSSPEGEGADDRMDAAGYPWMRWGENIAYGYPTPESVMSGWMNSAGHRENILDCNFRELGVGYANPNHYWTQVFGTR